MIPDIAPLAPIAGMSEPIGTLVNVLWVVFDLVVMSILVRAVLYGGYPAGAPAVSACAAARSSRRFSMTRLPASRKPTAAPSRSAAGHRIPVENG